MKLLEAGKQYLIPFGTILNAKYEQAHHLHKLARCLQRVEMGDIKRLMVFMPPRHGKSQLASIYFPAWFMGRNPTKSVIFSTYAQSFADDFGRKIRDVIQDDRYQSLFPEIKPRQDSNAAQRFTLETGGEFFAVGAMGPITGRGADLFIIDDPHKNYQEASSPVYQKRIFEWYSSVAETRLAPDGKIILIQTRWHENDLSGKILAGPDKASWTILTLPAISEDNQDLWPDRWPMELLLNRKRVLGSRDFAALYQQAPAPDEGGVIRRSWIKHWKELPARLDGLEFHWDLSFKGTDHSDFVVGQLWGYTSGERFLIDQVRDRMDFPTAIQAIRNMKAKHAHYNRTIPVVIEDKANGSAAISMLRKEITGVIAYDPKVSKEQRLKSVSPLFEAGNVLIPEVSYASWVADYIEELVTFPNAKHDDVVDATSQALIRIELNRSGSFSSSMLGSSVGLSGTIAGSTSRDQW